MDRETRAILAQRAAIMRRHMTNAERKLWLLFLREYQVPFVAQKVIGNYIVDFYCRKTRLSIELDGSQHYEPRSLAYDRIRTSYLEMLEIKELRFPNTFIFENFDGVCEAIHNEVEARRNDRVSIPLSLVKNKL